METLDKEELETLFAALEFVEPRYLNLRRQAIRYRLLRKLAAALD